MKKKLIIIAFSILMIVGLAGTFWGSSIAEAASSVWNSCQRGISDCTYPGRCHSYIDTNGDSICDRSQSNPDSSSATTNSSASVNSSTTTGTTGSTDTTSVTQNAATGSSSRTYYFIPILAALIVLYGLTWTLSAKKIMRTLLHRKIWNMILLVSALISCLLGLFLTVNIEFGANITLPFNMLFWHVEAGIALGVIAFFHILWHRRYFAKILGMNPNSKAVTEEASSPGQKRIAPAANYSRIERD